MPRNTSSAENVNALAGHPEYGRKPNASRQMTDVVARIAAEVVDRYRIDREIGAGGMATVYLAEDIRHRRKVAIKVLHPELSAVIGPDRFLKEIELTANLQHPHILPLFDSGVAEGLLYYVMPFVEGESLRDRLQRDRQLPIDEAIRISREVASALDYAHRRGVIHRDIKPENILVHDGQAVVADFGIALAVTNAGGGRLTQTGLSLGTPQYMSPEQATGERDIDLRCDIYSLGAVTYEMLTGEAPFTGPTAQAIVAKVITTDPARLTPQRKSIPSHVEAAVLKALEKMPADRFSSAAEFSKALGDTTFQTVRVTQQLHAGRSATGNRWRIAALSLAGLSVLLASVVGWQSSESAPELPTSRYSLVLNEYDITQAGDAPAVSPDGSKFVYANDEGALFIRDRNDLKATEIPGAANGWSPFFSPDGKTLGFVTGFPGALTTVPVAGGAVTRVVPDSAYGQGGSWSDDGWIYFLGSRGGAQSLMRVRPTGENLELIARPDTARDELFFYSPEALPGGRAVLLTVWRQKGTPDVAAFDLATRKLYPLGGGIRAMYAGDGNLLIVQPDGTITASRFDLRTLTTTGQRTVVLSGIRTGGQGRVMVALSRAGTLTYELYNPVNQIVRVDRQGVVEPVDASWTGAFSNVALSPNATQIAVAIQKDARTDIWVKNLKSGTLTRLAAEGVYSYRPTWSPDGSTVYFISDRPGKPSLFAVDADGRSPPRLLKGNPRGLDEATFSNDGKWLIHRIGSGGGRDVYVAGTGADSAARPLFEGKAEEFSPILSPDGRWVAYGSDESRRSEVYVRPFPDAGSARWQISRSGGTEPVWSSDGRELFYRNGKGDLIAASINGSAGFRVVSEQALFAAKDFVGDARHRTYSVSPDGKSFYFISVVPGPPSQLIVITNWFEELNAKLGRN